MLAYYVHNLNPEIIKFSEKFAIRWYGVSYLLGFLGAYLLLKVLIDRKIFKIQAKELPDFVMGTALFGILVGGRLGYVLFYQDKDKLFSDPLSIFRVWEGGMASHGGMIGVVLFMMWFGRKHKYPYWHLVDNIAVVVPVGLFFGRVANFINGELFGKPTQLPWAVIFPLEDMQPRHPSQLYEALGEGLVLFLVLWFVRHRAWSFVDGRLSALFLIVYGIIRITIETVRVPDASLWLGLTRGQFLSVIMVIVGFVMLGALGKKSPESKMPQENKS
ncbi:MAG: prolipoprotein diacylglyceryl transferase [Verrucomicrobiota bacterium]|nr:prolipoprotein diacylglyceryl transferase [Verrucomicrobiota bacterium]